MENINLEVVIERLDNLRKENAQEHAVIIAQTIKTNGTVAEIQKWRFITIGALIIMNLFFVPIVLAVVIQWILKVI